MGPETAIPASLDSPAVREGGRELLSLALMDARNHTLQLLARLEQAAPQEGVPPPLWVAGHIAWFAERWVSRNPRRAQGSACPAQAMRLASIDPQADALFDPSLTRPHQRAALPLPPADSVRAYLLETLETTLELLGTAQEDAAGLYFFRVLLWHEDLRAQQLAAMAQTLGVALGIALPAGIGAREPLALPAGTWHLGQAARGFAPGIERGDEPVVLPAFEIDAQPVGWAQYVEFIDDGGYDREELWHAQGWRWLQQQAQLEGRRGPRHVEQIGVASGAVLQTLFGKPTRMGGSQSVMHVSWWEADAYARWAQRRLPTEAEWEMAAHLAGRRGFRWGDVQEWTAGTLRRWPGSAQDVWAADADLDPEPALGKARVLRGASFAARARMKYVTARGWALPEHDQGFVGFRTCAA